MACGRRESRGQPEFDVFRVISKGNWVDCVEERVHAWHVETLRAMEATYILSEDPVVFDK